MNENVLPRVVSYSLRYAALLGTLALAGCTTIGITQLQDTVGKFDQAAHSTASAEMAFLGSVQSIDQQTQFYQAAFAYVTNQETNFDVTGDFKSTLLTSDQIATRKALMDALTLYADKMQAIACGDDDKQLDSNSQSLANNLIGLASSRRIPTGSESLDRAVETAVDAIARLALDRLRATDLRKTAAEMQPHLATIVKALQQENDVLGKTVIANLGQIEIELRTIVAMSHQHAPDDAAATFFSIMQSRKLLTDTNALMTYPGNSTVPVKGEIAKPINDTLSAILNGNEAIARKGAGGLAAAATDLYERAQTAKEFYQSLEKSK
ncbi:MAG TPA: hypothetical protein VIM69_05965 [Opitutaceae bacterium]